MPDPLLQEPAAPVLPSRDLSILDAMRASQEQGLIAPGYQFDTGLGPRRGDPMDEQESLATQFALAVPRGIEGMLKGVYGFADFVAFDSLPDWKKRLLGQSTHWAPGLLEGLATYAIPGTVGVKALGVAQKGITWGSRLGRAAAAGAIVDAVVTDPYGGRLSDWAREAGVDWAVTDYLATDPDDSEATARFKNALEGIVPGLALDAVGEVFRAVRSVRRGQPGNLDPKPVQRAVASMWREEFGFDHDEAAAVESFIEAAGLDRTKIRAGSELPEVARAGLDQSARAYTLFREDGTAFIGALRNPDLTSALHELAHVARRQLFDPERGVAPKIEVSAEDLATAQKWAGADQGWDVKAEEKFAAGFERYLRDGAAPSKGLERFFEKVATYFRRVYQDLTGTALDLEVTPEMADVFGRVLSRGERLSLERTKVEGLGRSSDGSLLGLVRGPQTAEGRVDLVLYSRDGDLREAAPEGAPAVVAPQVSRETPFPGTLEARAAKATADQTFLYRASMPAERVLVVKPGDVPTMQRLESGGYLAWREADGPVHLVKAVPVARMGRSTLKASEVENVRAPGLNRALAQDADVLYQGALREGDAPQFGNERFDDAQPYEPINLDRIASPEGARQALMDALSKVEARERAVQPLSTAHDRALQAVHEFADANGEAAPHDLVAKILNRSADQIRQHADRLGAAREILADLGRQLHLKIKAATKSGTAAAASDDELVEILRAQQNIAAVTERVRDVQSEIARALGAQRIRYRGTSFDGKEWIPPRPDAAPEVLPTPDQATPSVLPSGAPDRVPDAPPVEIVDPATLPRASTKAIIEAHGGRAKVEKLVNQLDAYMDANPGALPPAAVRRGWFSMVPEYYVNSILSGPITHATNLLSGMMNSIVVPLERALGNAVLGRGSAARGELADLTWHLRESREAVKLAQLALKRDRSLLFGGNAGVMEGGQTRAISAAAQGVDADSLSGRVLNSVGKVANIPARLLLAEDELIKQLNYRARFGRRLTEIAQERFQDAETRAEWVEQMLKASGEEGQVYSVKTLQARAQRLAAKNGIPPEAQDEYVAAYMTKHWDEDIHRASLDAQQRAREATFTEELGEARGERGITKRLIGISGRDAIGRLSGGFAQLTNQHPALRLFFPFIRTPTNILQWFLDRSAGAVSDSVRFLADSQVRASYTPQARAELIGRFATGSALITLAATYASQRDDKGLPILTGAGPTDPDERRAWEATGWRPYSIRMGDQYVSYKRLDPAATFFGIVADLVQDRAYSEMLNRQPETGQALMVALTNNLFSKTYMLGALNLARALGEPERFMPNLLESFAGAAAPFSSAVHQAVNPLKGDEVLHEIRGLGEAFKSKWILSDPNKRPVRRNVLGEPILRDQGIGGDPWSPLRYVEVKDDPVAEELVRTGAGFQPPRETSNGVDWTLYRNAETGQNAYDRWMELHGQVQIGGRSLRDALEQTIGSSGYQRLPTVGVDDLDSPRVAALRRVVSRYREAARRQVFQEFPDLSSDARKLLVAARMLRSGQAVESVGVGQ